MTWSDEEIKHNQSGSPHWAMFYLAAYAFQTWREGSVSLSTAVEVVRTKEWLVEEGKRAEPPHSLVLPNNQNSLS